MFWPGKTLVVNSRISRCRKWFGSYAAGVIQYDYDTFHIYSLDEGLALDKASYIASVVQLVYNSCSHG
jgi:hypothetical protein